jgi:uncharacterized protein YjiS (DUF1127 family)
MQAFRLVSKFAPDASFLEAAVYDVPSARSLPAPRQRQSTIFDVCLAAARDLARLIAALAAELRIRRDMRRLAAMDDHILKDIGLRRCEIEYRVRHGRDGCVSRSTGGGIGGRWAYTPYLSGRTISVEETSASFEARSAPRSYPTSIRRPVDLT